MAETHFRGIKRNEGCGMNEQKNYAWPVSVSSKEVYQYFLTKVKLLKEQLSNRTILIFGAGIRGTLLAIILQEEGFQEFSFVDNNKDKWGGNINGYPIMSFEEACHMDPEPFFLLSMEDCEKVTVQVKAAGFVEDEDYCVLNASLYDFYMEEYKRENENKVLIMGDCGLTHVPIVDSGADNLGTILKKRLGENKSKVLAMHGMGMNSYYHIFRTYVKEFGYPQRVLLMTNFETMTGKQHLLPRSQHYALLQRVYQHSQDDSEFGAYLKLVKERAENFKIEIVSASDKDSYEEQARNYMRYNYTYRLRESNENIEYLQKFLDLLQQNHVEVTTYIPPVNYEYAKELEIPNFEERYRYNVDLLKKIQSKYEVTVLDLSHFLTREEFATPITVDETANYQGNMKQAAEMIRVIGET